jgi:hypothetical protein
MNRETWTDLLAQVAQDHHVAFADTDGEDPDWPAWYARRLQEKVSAAEGEADEARLAGLLDEAAQRYKASGTTEPWPEFYAHFLVEQLQS